jgi:4-carboxymuconolactone decarboxylase
MAILITLREWTAGYEWAAHYPIALKAGLKKEIADSIGDGRRPSTMAPDEEILYDFSIEILRDKRVSDATYKRAVGAFGEQGVVELLSVHGYYTFLAIVNNATRTCSVQIETAACPAWQSLSGATPSALHKFPN